MQNIFVELLPPWVETGLQPAFYDKESGSVLQQTARMYAKVNELVELANHQNEVIDKYIDEFNQLHNYVHDYFDNLDVQEEINNKLDQMAETGAFNTIIAQYAAPYIDALNKNYGILSDNVNNVINTQNAKIEALTSSTPIVVSNVSGMTDTSKIYILTTDGEWYYHNGTQWVSGGVYQATALADESVTFSNLDNPLRDVLGLKTLNTSADYNWEQGIISANGTPGSDTTHSYWYMTIRTSQYIPLNQAKYLYFTKITNYHCAVFLYDDNNNLIVRLLQGDNWDPVKVLINLEEDYPTATKMKCTLRQRSSINPTLEPSDYDKSMYYMVIAGSPDPVYEPEDEYVHETSDNLITLPSLTFGNNSYASGQCLVDNYLISFGISDDDHLTYKEAHIFKIDKTTRTYELVRTVLHNFGHVNSVDYCKETDCLIFGNGSGAYGREGNFAIYKGFKAVVEDNTVTTLNYSDCMEFDCSNVPFKNEDKWNVVWFDSNRNSYDLAILVTNDLTKFRVLQLAKGRNEFNYGTITRVADDEFNGTFRVCETYEFDPGDMSDHVIQDMDYQSGKLYCGVSHNYPYYWVFKFDPLTESVTREIVPIYAYTPQGEATYKPAQAICCNDEYVIINTGYIIFKPRI